MSNDSQKIVEWRVSEAEFRGFTKAMLENIQADIKEIKESEIQCRTRLTKKIEGVESKVDKNGSDITNIKLFAAGLGGLGGVAGSIIGFLFNKGGM